MESISDADLQNSGEFRLTPEEAQKRYSIKSGAYYKRLEAANVKHRKDDEGVFLDAEQVAILDQLDDHLKNGGKLDEFSPGKLSTIGNKSAAIATSQEMMGESVGGVNNDLAQKLDRSAQSVAASFLADARNRLTAEYLQNPDRIDEDLKSQVFISPSPRGIDQDWAGHHIAAAINRVKAGEI